MVVELLSCGPCVILTWRRQNRVRHACGSVLSALSKFVHGIRTILGHQTFGDNLIYSLPQATTPFLRRYLLALPEHRGIDLRCEPLCQPLLHPSESLQLPAFATTASAQLVGRR